MYASKDELLRRAERHEENAKNLRALASGKFINNKGEEFAVVKDGKLQFNSKNAALELDEFRRFALWLNRVFAAFGGKTNGLANRSYDRPSYGNGHRSPPSGAKDE